LQAKFELLCELEEEQKEEVLENAEEAHVEEEKGVVNAFVNIIRAGFMHEQVDEKDMAVYKNAITTDKTGDEAGLGVVVPEDIQTTILELRRGQDNLEEYVNVEGVSTKTGVRNVEVDAANVPFDNVDEAADFPDADEPKFKAVTYNIKKKGGLLKLTAELFEDAAENVMAYINKWIAKKTKATRNAMILKVMDEMTAKSTVTIKDVDALKDIFNETLDPAIAEGAVIVTNQSGFNALDKLKDADGNYILMPDPMQATKGKLLFGKHPVIRLSNKTLASTAGKHPIYCGDLKEAVTLFDRGVLTIDVNNYAGGLWEKDLTGVKVRDRFDVQPVDTNALVKGTITSTVSA
jgi:HK97 family phage major capsid protein